jgi:enamine deaminase RidA (YjgF/YER057c/UK114 family)
VSPEERLRALGLALPTVASPAGNYVPALVHGSTVWTSGQLPFVDGVLIATGLVGEGDGQVSLDTARECARIAALNALSAMADACGRLDRIERIVRVVGYVASTPGFHAQPSVVNGASDLMVEVFGDAGRHTRSAVGVAALPLGSPVEIEVEARLR